MGNPHKHAELIKAWANGAEIEQMCEGVISWMPFRGQWHELGEFRIKPGRVYPMTSLTDEELRDAWRSIENCNMHNWDDARAVANLAIRRYIDDTESEK